MRSILTQHDVDRLRELYAQLPGLSWTASNRLRIFPPAQALEAEDLRRFQEAHEEVRAVMSKMSSILGD